MSQFSRRRFLQLAGHGIASAGTMATASGWLRLGIRTTQAQEPLILQMRHLFTPGSNAVISAALSAWAESSGAEVDLRFLGHHQMEDTLALFAEGSILPENTPHLLETVHLAPHTYADSLVDVSDLCQELGDTYGGWADIARATARVNGIWRGVPHFASGDALVVREDLFAQAGIGLGEDFPATWDDLLIAGTALKQMGKPLGFPLGRAVDEGNRFVFSLLWSFGASITDESGTINLNTPQTRQAIAFVEQMYHDAMLEDVISWDDASNNRKFTGDEISCTTNHASILFVAERDALDFAGTINHYPLPTGPAGRIQLLEVNTLQILSHADETQIALAKDLLSLLYTPAVWQPLAAGTLAFTLSLLQQYHDEPAMPWNADPHLAAFGGLVADGAVYGYPAPPSPAAEAVAEALLIVEMFSKVCTGEWSIDESIRQTEAACRRIYAAYA